MNSCTSPIAEITHDVPQGSILGPLLFNLYINDLVNSVQSDMILCADDSVVFVTANSLDEAGRALQKDLLNIGTWCKFHKLSINVKKTKAMHFGAKSLEPVVPNIEITNNGIEFVNSYKCLGINLDSKMSFHYQYKETYKLASYKLLFLKRVRPIVTEHTALTIVKSMLLPYLDMINLLLSSQTNKDLSNLDVILNTALRTVYCINVPRSVYMLEVFTKANIFPLKYRRKYLMLNLAHRLIITGQIKQVEAQRETRHNAAPVLHQPVPLNNIISKSPTFVMNSYWNNLPVDTRNINGHDQFKNTIRNMVNSEYVRDEMARLTTGLFNVP